MGAVAIKTGAKRDLVPNLSIEEFWDLVIRRRSVCLPAGCQVPEVGDFEEIGACLVEECCKSLV